jgi:proliferating cell nuclear antigen
MEITINQGAFFRKLITAIRDLTTEAEFKFDATGLVVRTMDSSHVCMIDISLDATFFGSWNVQNCIKLGIDLDNLNNILKVSSINSDIRMYYVTDADILQLNINEGRKNIEFQMKLKQNSYDTINIDEYTHDFIVNLNTDEFKKTIKDLSAFGDRCTITVNENKGIIFNVIGDAGNGKIEILDPETENPGNVEDDIKLTFSLKYLTMFSKTNLGDSLSLKFSRQVPFCCEYVINDNSVCRFWLAQLLDDNEPTGDGDEPEETD